MRTNPPHWRAHCEDLADVLEHAAFHFERALRQVVDMLPGLTGQPFGSGGGSGGGGTSVVERLALAPSVERHQHQELIDLPGQIHDDTRRLCKASTHQQSTDAGRMTMSRLHLLHIAAHGPRPNAKQLQRLTTRIWRLDQLVTLWAVGEERQRDLRKEAGGPATTNDEIWCVNCRQHGHTTPRHASGIMLCKWCADFKTEWAILPDAKLLDTHHRRRVTSADIQRALVRGGSKRKVA
jgi:hypothetical protein